MGEITENSTEAEMPSEFIDPTNYAEDESVVERFKEDVWSLIPQIEDQRGPLEENWKRYRDVWARQNNAESEFYVGINNAYIPQAFKVIETQVAQLMSAVFPAGPRFAIAPNMACPPQLLQMITTLLEHNIEQSEIETKFEPFIRNGLIYGFTVEKNVWREECKTVYTRAVQVDPMTGMPQVVPQKKKLYLYQGPTFHVVDPFAFYVYPFNCLTISDARIVFERDKRTLAALKVMEGDETKPGRYSNTARCAEAAQSRGQSKIDSNRDQITESIGMQVDQIKVKGQVEVYEIWCKFDLLGDGSETDCLATVANGHVIELRQNPLFDQRPPYEVWSPYNTMDSIYKMGIGEIVEHHQYILNAVINQMLDANLFQTNQMMAIDASRYQGRLTDLEITPFSVLPFSGGIKDAVQFFKPADTTVTAMQVAGMIAGSMQDSAGAPPVVQGKFTNKERTATETSAVQEGAMTAINGMARGLALQILSKWLRTCFFREQQFRDPQSEMQVTGMPPFKLPPEALIGDYTVRWLVAPQSEEYLAQQQAMMQQSAMMDPGAQDANGGSVSPTAGSEGLGAEGGPGAGSGP